MPYYAGHPSGYLYQDVILDSFTGGRVNVPQVLGPAQLDKKQSPYSINIDTAGGSIRKPGGFVPITSGTVTGDVSSLWFDFFTSTTYVGYGTHIGKLVGSSISSIGTGYTNNAVWSFSRVKDYISCFNDAKDAPQLWNSNTSTLSAITTPPATWIAGNYPIFGVSWMGRTFAPIGDILYYSKLYDSTNYTPGITATDGGAITIGGDGIPIKALIPLAAGLLIIKGPGLYFLSGNINSGGSFDQTTFTWNLLSPIVDALGWNASVSVSDTVYIWGRQFVWAIQGTQEIQRIQVGIISQNIQYDVGTVTGHQTSICAVIYPQRHQIWWNVAGSISSTQTDTVHVYDYENNQWMYRSGYAHKSMCNILDGNGNWQIYSGGYSGNGYVFQQNVGVDFNGVAMACTYYTPYISLIGLPEGKPMLAVFVLGPQTNTQIQYSYAYDFVTAAYDTKNLPSSGITSDWHTAGSGSGTTWGTPIGGSVGTWQSAQPVNDLIWLYGYGRRIQHRFYSNSIGANFDILEIKHPTSTIGYR